jgi:microcompartment protein CcmK/EutM
MRIAQIIGNVTLSRTHPSLRGGRYRLATPLTLADLQSEQPSKNEAIVVYDELNAGDGQWIAVSEGGEAAQPFQPEEKPIDAYNAAILDHVGLVTENKQSPPPKRKRTEK